MARSNNEIKSLILAKKLYLHGCSHAENKDMVSRMFAILHFDNAAEIVTKCMARKCEESLLNISKNDKIPEMYGPLLDVIINALKKEAFRQNCNMGLSLIQQMKKLHKLRNSVQHQGDIPDIESVINYEVYTEDFFREVCTKIFDISYEELYLSELIENKGLKEQLLRAEKAFEEGNYNECIKLSEESLKSAYKKIVESNILQKGIEKLIEMFPVETIDGYVIKMSTFQSGIRTAIEAAVTIQFLSGYRGDFLKYVQIISNLDQLSDNLKHSAEFCLDFVTNLVLKWQEEGIFPDRTIYPSGSRP